LYTDNFLFLFISYISGEAMKIEEYVQTIVQKIMTRVNPDILSGPNTSMATSTNKRVALVYILLEMVSQIERVIISSSDFFFHQ